MLAAQAIQHAYESFNDCNCTNNESVPSECHDLAKLAFKKIIRIPDTTHLNKQYGKIKSKVETLASVVCRGGETVIKLKEILAVEFSEGNNVCANSSNVSEMSDKCRAEGLGALTGEADCAVEFGKDYIKAKYIASGKTSEQISAVADKLVTHFGAGRRLATSYDELYADQDSEEVEADDSDTSGSVTSTPEGSAVSSNAEGPSVRIGMAVVALISGGVFWGGLLE